MFESKKVDSGLVSCTMSPWDARVLAYACDQYAKTLRESGGDDAGRNYAKVLSHVAADLTRTVEGRLRCMP